jgi:hypothetical protein
MSSNFLDLSIQQAATRVCVPWMWSTFLEKKLYLFECLASGLGVADKSLNRCSKTESTENNEQLPGDVLETRGNKKADGEVK